MSDKRTTRLAAPARQLGAFLASGSDLTSACVKGLIHFSTRRMLCILGRA